ncbi:MAG: ATP-binding cassette domain-containing protein [Planctomycetaceae bacterium]
MVEHDPDFIEAADEVIEIGPAAGQDGGTVVFQGTPAELLRSNTVTGRSLAAAREMQRRANGTPSRPVDTEPPTAKVPQKKERSETRWLKLRNVNCHNIRGLDVDIPLGTICAVTGVSGSGKSSLIADALYPHVARMLGQVCDPPSDASVASIDGVSQIGGIEMLDQSSLKTSSRSVPATYVGAFDDIRGVLADTHEARKRNYKAGMFSFNSAKGGRCENCSGLGSVTIEMQFLADIETTCDVCGGKRFRADVLEVRYRDRSVCDILDMTSDDAFTFFNGHRRIQQRLNSLRQAGLGYVRLGQPISTLSGGECQRLRIASLLAGTDASAESPRTAGKASSAESAALGTLFILDEPSTGLHLHDIDQLMQCLNHLVEIGHSILVIEHDQSLIAHADYIIELGPGAGKSGGRIIFAGPQTGPDLVS